MQRAHAPYSNFPVGAALRGRDGKIYAGCNVENAAYPEGWCAETSAIAALVLAGGQAIEELVVMGRGEALVTPCGGCRQRIREFAAADIPIHVCGPEGLRRSFTLAQLLPQSFGPDNVT
jgi:cytidine deaminase|tara:strand:+ start:3932 stop:4288 length:357 start_codon:yes stop_codon:yes gene_type:complete